MSEQSQRPEQRAFSPKEVSTMLGVGRSTILSLVEEGELGSIKIDGSRRIFLSDLESYLGDDRARSLVRDLNSDRSEGQGEERVSQFERVAEKYSEIPDDKAIVISDLSESDLRSMRDLLHRRFGKENVIIRSAKQVDGTFKAVVRSREDDEYLRD